MEKLIWNDALTRYMLKVHAAHLLYLTLENISKPVHCYIYGIKTLQTQSRY